MYYELVRFAEKLWLKVFFAALLWEKNIVPAKKTSWKIWIIRQANRASMPVFLFQSVWGCTASTNWTDAFYIVIWNSFIVFNRLVHGSTNPPNSLVLAQSKPWNNMYIHGLGWADMPISPSIKSSLTLGGYSFNPSYALLWCIRMYLRLYVSELLEV
jgi:hypothetical protein